MKIALVAESFLPSINGVTNSLLRALDHLAGYGHDALVLAPQPAWGDAGARALRSYAGAPVVWLPALALPGYRTFRVSPVGVARVRAELSAFGPDVVHLGSPFVLGWDAVRAANQLGLPCVAVYQTDVPSYAARYGVAGVETLLWRRVHDIHRRATLTLAPSTAACRQLRTHGIPRVRRWARGVDARRFTPDRRDPRLRVELGGDGRVLVVYVGRMAAEKQLEDLARIDQLDGVQLIMVGDGPLRPRLERLLSHATFLGWREGDDLARIVASCDIAVHTGARETFGQSVQEAMAAGLPVVAVAAGGMIDLIEPGRNGLLYRSGDLDALVAHVSRLAMDRDLRVRLGAAARADVGDRSWSRIGDQLIGHYRDAVAAGAWTAAAS